MPCLEYVLKIVDGDSFLNSNLYFIRMALYYIFRWAISVNVLAFTIFLSWNALSFRLAPYFFFTSWSILCPFYLQHASIDFTVESFTPTLSAMVLLGNRGISDSLTIFPCLRNMTCLRCEIFMVLRNLNSGAFNFLIYFLSLTVLMPSRYYMISPTIFSFLLYTWVSSATILYSRSASYRLLFYLVSIFSDLLRWNNDLKF